MISFAGTQISAEQALDHLRHYATAFAPTVRYYDYNGDTTKPPAPADGVQMSDIARLVVINADLRASDVPALLNTVPADLWQAVRHDARFEDLPDNPLHDQAYEALLNLYSAYEANAGLGRTKVSKILHLKRPALVPILDSVAEAAYKDAAQDLAMEFGEGKALYWAAIWRDARTNGPALAALTETLRAKGHEMALVADLPALRLHDILVWSHFRQRR